VAAWSLVRLGVALFAVVLLISPSAVAEEGLPGRTEYVERVEPICEQGTDASDRILDGVRDKVKNDRLSSAGHQFLRAADAFGKTIERVDAVPRPSADEPRLRRWIDLLRKVAQGLHAIGIDLQRGDRVRANHDAIRAERSGNAANNAGFAFNFHSCRLRSSMFS
jgi:hypothetical protein